MTRQNRPGPTATRTTTGARPGMKTRRRWTKSTPMGSWDPPHPAPPRVLVRGSSPEVPGRSGMPRPRFPGRDAGHRPGRTSATRGPAPSSSHPASGRRLGLLTSAGTRVRMSSPRHPSPSRRQCTTSRRRHRSRSTRASCPPRPDWPRTTLPVRRRRRRRPSRSLLRRVWPPLPLLPLRWRPSRWPPFPRPPPRQAGKACTSGCRTVPRPRPGGRKPPPALLPQPPCTYRTSRAPTTKRSRNRALGPGRRRAYSGRETGGGALPGWKPAAAPLLADPLPAGPGPTPKRTRTLCTKVQFKS